MKSQELIEKALPCPFCGEKPVFDYGYEPTYIELKCFNDDCFARPTVKAFVTHNLSIMFMSNLERHIPILLDKWNKRYTGKDGDPNCDHDWKHEKFDIYGLAMEQYCEKCGRVEQL